MSTQGDNLKAIADAIRTAEGSTGTIPAAQFAQRIAALKGGDPFAFEISIYPMVSGGSRSIYFGATEGMTWRQFVKTAQNQSGLQYTVAGSIVCRSLSNYTYIITQKAATSSAAVDVRPDDAIKVATGFTYTERQQSGAVG